VNGGLVGRRRRRIVTAAARRKREANDHAGSAEQTGHLDQYGRLSWIQVPRESLVPILSAD
jgi:hypothetical protein